MILAKYTDDNLSCVLFDKAVKYQFSTQKDRTYTVEFKTHELAEEYYLKKTNSYIPRIEKIWTYYTTYVKMSFGNDIKYYSVHQRDIVSDNYVFEVENINGKWKDIKELEKSDYISTMIMKIHNKLKKEKLEVSRNAWENECEMNANTKLTYEELEEELKRVEREKEYEEYLKTLD